MNKRTAYFKSDFRTLKDEETGKIYLEGYFIVYEEETVLFEGCYEEVRQYAARNCLKINDIRCLYNHNTGSVLGRTGNGTLMLKEDEKGVYGKVEINESDPEAMSVYAKVARGDVDSCSFGFYVVEETSEKREDGMKFFLEKLDVFEVSIVTFPAYPQTEVAARSKDILNLSKRNIKTKKKILKEKLQNGTKTNYDPKEN